MGLTLHKDPTRLGIEALAGDSDDTRTTRNLPSYSAGLFSAATNGGRALIGGQTGTRGG